MALKLTFNICQNSGCKSIKFTETTGEYPTVSTGWEDSVSIGDATEATLLITLPDLTIVVLDLLTESFPSSIDKDFIITSAMLGYGTNVSIPDGLYSFEYTVIADGTTYTTKVDKMFYCQAKCCVDKLLATIADQNCECGSSEINEALTAFTYFQALKEAARCGKKSRFAKILKIVNKLCSTSNCGCN